jgi:hypothetical protein
MPSEFLDAVVEAAGHTFTRCGLVFLLAGVAGLAAGFVGLAHIAAEQLGLMLVGGTLFALGRLVPRAE